MKLPALLLLGGFAAGLCSVPPAMAQYASPLPTITIVPNSGPPPLQTPDPNALRGLAPSYVVPNAMIYDGKTITMGGNIVGLKATIESDGTKVTTYQLCDSSYCVNVIDRSNPKWADGEAHDVKGTYRQSFRTPDGSRILQNYLIAG
ncbi:MAG TPA: hypothetical protein VKG44_01670 [Candidatus Baltobacteraceae bacterium]|nr:hypothetical protein [Candidatus Baltobacteraceae bacterium]